LAHPIGRTSHDLQCGRLTEGANEENCQAADKRVKKNQRVVVHQTTTSVGISNGSVNWSCTNTWLW